MKTWQGSSGDQTAQLVARNIGLYNGTTSEEYILNPGCDLYLNGGSVLLPTFVKGTSGMGYFILGDNSYGATYRHARLFPMVVHHNGSFVSMPEGNSRIMFGVFNSTPGTARWEYRRGTFSPNVNLYTQISNVMEVVKIGSAESPRLAYVNAEATWGAFNKAVCAFVLDKSLEHISPWVFTDAGGRCFGSLRIQLDGGVLVTKKDTFDLITIDAGFATLVSSNKKSYYDLPDTSLWTTQLSADLKTSQVKLTDALGTAPAENGKIVFSSPKAMGSVEMTEIRTGVNLKEQYVDLALQDTAGTPLSTVALVGLRDKMVAAGYTNSTVIAENGYNLRVAFAPTMLEKGTSRFVWDFTSRPGVHALATADDVVTTNACVSTVRFSAKMRNGFMLMIR